MLTYLGHMTTHEMGASQGRTYEFRIGDRLRIAREHLGLDQRAFAVLIDVSKGTVSNYENGHTAPKTLVVKAWALATGFDPGWLMTGVPPEAQPAEGGEPAAPETRRLHDSPSGDRFPPTPHHHDPVTVSCAA